ncbi:MAG: hypothetical protein G01um101438_127 [Parcubacteria group bacterium Gr01-1014_38]|nr:MAG: hypothetical protein G01um101438_127 [Parcubacteria group bacterium Gr01-1014_38]
MPEGEFENQPATKRDLADMSEELMKEIHSVEESLEKRIEALSVDMKKGFHHLEELFKGPEGLSERLERVEKRVGLKI